MTKENKQRLIEAKNNALHEQFPSFPKAYFPETKYSDRTANGLTKCVIEFLNCSGHQAERISSTGRPIDNTKISTDVIGRQRTIGSVKWIKGTSTNGTADISSTINVVIGEIPVGLSVKWEVKIGKDKQSDDQKKYEKDVKTAGGYYFIIKSFDEFIDKYDRMIEFYKGK